MLFCSDNSANVDITLRLKYYFAILLLLLIWEFILAPVSSWAADPREFSLLIGFWTRHVEPSDDTNEKTGMLALLYNDYIVSRFTNSYNDETFLVGKRFHTRKIPLPEFKFLSIQGSLYTGLMYGYSDNLPNIGGITVGALPTVGLVWGKTSAELGYVPTPSGGVFTSLFRYSFELP